MHPSIHTYTYTYIPTYIHMIQTCIWCFICLYVPMYVCTYVFMHVPMYVRINARMYLCMFVRRCMYVPMYACIIVCTYQMLVYFDRPVCDRSMGWIQDSLFWQNIFWCGWLWVTHTKAATLCRLKFWRGCGRWWDAECWPRGCGRCWDEVYTVYNLCDHSFACNNV
jgi:hypothetical protein